jgi:hypothetical protein
MKVLSDNVSEIGTTEQAASDPLSLLCNFLATQQR